MSVSCHCSTLPMRRRLMQGAHQPQVLTTLGAQVEDRLEAKFEE